MDLSNEEAAEFARQIIGHLERIGATDIVKGLEQSRILGVEGTMDVDIPDDTTTRFIFDAEADFGSDVKNLGTRRRRPLSELEVLQTLIEHLNQRLVAVPAMARFIQRQLHTTDVAWRVDSEFTTATSASEFEFPFKALVPAEVDEAADAMRKLMALVPSRPQALGSEGN
jgi:hypothetical protein